MVRYSILVGDNKPEFCAIYNLPPNLRNPRRPARGVRMQGSYADGIEFRMAEEVSGIQVADVINNTLGYLMVTTRMKTLLEAQATAEIEYLRFVLLNHKGRAASDECYIVNVIGSVDCVDVSRTVGEFSPIRSGEFFELRQLFLLEDRVPEHLNMFRIASYPRVVIVREDLRGKILQAGMAARFIEPGDEARL